jgi:UDP-N-acetylglucosamine--N-acetylmuramyl-(pentapeptide) pyrophosphoryl-undecaprenol N-acetylglucosamine transferase
MSAKTRSARPWPAASRLVSTLVRGVPAGENQVAVKPSTFVMAGGGTGGHVLPLLAVAEELRRRGHEILFFGTRKGLESRLVPAKEFPIEYIEIGGLKGLGLIRKLQTLWRLPVSTARVLATMLSRRPSALFSMGGYVAGPAVIAALLQGVPVVAMEPNAVPGLTNLRLGRYVRKTLLGFPETARYFPPAKTEVTGLPVREEFFAIPPKPIGSKLHLLITGGSAGSRTLNQAARQSWPLFRAAGLPVHILHQTGRDAFVETHAAFSDSGLDGEVVPFIDNMPDAFASSDLVVSRAGAGALAELAAAGKPSILVPYPFATDKHQLRNAEAFERAGAARLILDKDMTGENLFQALSQAAPNSERMGAAARKLSKPGAARRAADLLEALI